jgi:hypothetical protein
VLAVADPSAAVVGAVGKIPRLHRGPDHLGARLGRSSLLGVSWLEDVTTVSSRTPVARWRHSWSKGHVVAEFSAIARERAALATVADAIVAASVGKGLWVAVACPVARLAVVDYLAQALHARGRAARCLPATPDPSVAGELPLDPREDGSTVVVITSGLVTDTDRGVQRVNVLVTTDVNRRELGEVPALPGGIPDVILAYGEPHRPMIQYMATFLSAGTEQ